MPTKIKISLMGSIAVYDDGTNWNLVFITDHDHRFIISDLDGDHPDQTIRMTGKNRHLSLVAGDVGNPQRSYSQNAQRFGLNMSADYLHDFDKVTKKSNLNRADSPGPGRELVRVTVPYGVIDCPVCPGPDCAPDYWI